MSPQTSLQKIQQFIKSEAEYYQRSASEIRLVAVSKKQSIAAIKQAIAAGQLDFGESYVQEALPKIKKINNPDLCWHFIGPLQANKTRQVANHFDWLHSLDRSKIAERLSKQRASEKPALNVCIQVNISNEASKSGVAVHDVEQLANIVDSLPQLKLRGLMSMPAPGLDFNQQRQAFAQTRNLLEQLNKSGFKLDTLSMGTSYDLAAAIAEGSTMLRIGSAIFGKRSK